MNKFYNYVSEAKIADGYKPHMHIFNEDKLSYVFMKQNIIIIME